MGDFELIPFYEDFDFSLISSK